MNIYSDCSEMTHIDLVAWDRLAEMDIIVPFKDAEKVGNALFLDTVKQPISDRDANIARQKELAECVAYEERLREESWEEYERLGHAL